MRNIGQKSFTAPKVCLFINLWCNITPVAPLLKRQVVECPRLASIFRRPVHIILHALALLVVIGYSCHCNEHKLLTVSWDRVVHTYKNIRQRVKTGSSTGPVLRQGSSQPQEYKSARMPRRIAVDQNVCAWDGGHPELTVRNLLNYSHELGKFYCITIALYNNRIYPSSVSHS